MTGTGKKKQSRFMFKCMLVKVVETELRLDSTTHAVGKLSLPAIRYESTQFFSLRHAPHGSIGTF